MILPIPSKKEITKVYESDYLSQRHQPHPGVDLRIRFSREYRPTVFAEYALSLEDVKIKKNEVRSILDYGCADGIFLEFCKDYFNPGTQLYGTDLSTDLLDQARKSGWSVFSLAEMDNIKTKFDLITLWDVIEHVEDPAAVISSLKKMLAPKGKIFLETPRAGLLGDLYGDKWPHLLPVQHIGLPTKEGMEKLAARMGLTMNSYCTFGSNAPSSHVPQPYKGVFDKLAKKLEFGDVQILTLVRKN